MDSRSGGSSTHGKSPSSTTSVESTEVGVSTHSGSAGSTNSHSSTVEMHHTTIPDHDNIHAGTVDTDTTVGRRTTPVDGKMGFMESVSGALIFGERTHLLAWP